MGVMAELPVITTRRSIGKNPMVEAIGMMTDYQALAARCSASPST